MASSTTPRPPDAPRTLLISGGQGDLAQAIAHHFRQSGWLVFQPGRAELDVTDAASVRAFVASLDLPVDLLVNNAGMVRDQLLLRMDPAAWDAVMETNLAGAFRLSQAVLPGMLRQRRGHLVHLGSFSALHPPAGQANYAAAKAALIGLSHSLAAEYGSRNIRSNCILPGFLATKMTLSLPPEEIERARQAHALGRFNTPEDVARFLECLDRLENVSGQVFQLDSRLRPWT